MLLAAPAGAETVWQKDSDFVRIEKADGQAAPSSLPKLSADAVRAVLAAVRIAGDGDDGPLLDESQLDLVSAPISRALADAGQGRDVVFAVHAHAGFMDYLGPPRSTAGRIFVDGDSIGLIIGMVHDTYLTGAFTPDPTRIRTGSRVSPQETEHRIVPGGAVSLAVAGRTDWAKVSPVAWTGTYGMPMVQAPAAPAAPVAGYAAAPVPAAPAVAAPMAPAAPVAAAVPQDPKQIEERFAALKRLLDNHMISQDEYDHAKADLLKAISSLPH